MHNFIEELCDKFPEIWKELQNCRNITIDKNLWIIINPIMIIISVVLSLIFLLLTIINYNKKELV